MPGGPEWGQATRRMLTFDNLIGNPDRNAGNILIGPLGQLILIDHSRAFTDETRLPRKVERVDARLWAAIQSLTADDFTQVLQPWIGAEAVGALLERRKEMGDALDKLLVKKPRALVIVD
jgi:hypothetical protein